MHDHFLMPLGKCFQIQYMILEVIWTFIIYQCSKGQIHGDNTSYVHIAQLAANFVQTVNNIQ